MAFSSMEKTCREQTKRNTNNKLVTSMCVGVGFGMANMNIWTLHSQMHLCLMRKHVCFTLLLDSGVRAGKRRKHSLLCISHSHVQGKRGNLFAAKCVFVHVADRVCVCERERDVEDVTPSAETLTHITAHSTRCNIQFCDDFYIFIHSARNGQSYYWDMIAIDSLNRINNNNLVGTTFFVHFSHFDIYYDFNFHRRWPICSSAHCTWYWALGSTR